MTDDRSEFEANRAAGLRARHETREARAVRRQAANDIATAILAKGRDETPARLHAATKADQDHADAIFAAYKDAADLAHRIGAEETPS